MYVSDGDYIKDIEINDLRNKYVITRSATLNDIKAQTGAGMEATSSSLSCLSHQANRIQDVTTRGKYLPDKSMATPTVWLPDMYKQISQLTRRLESSALFARDKHFQRGTREGRCNH